MCNYTSTRKYSAIGNLFCAFHYVPDNISISNAIVREDKYFRDEAIGLSVQSVVVDEIIMYILFMVLKFNIMFIKWL